LKQRDAYTGGHIDRVCTYSRDLAKALHWDQAALIVLEFGAILHDVGKIAIPDRILNKRGKLDEEEQKIMRSHAELGTSMLKEVTHLQAALPYILCHHERWDGKGYPHQLVANEIPMEGRLLAIVDAYDAMTTDRPYSKSKTSYEALQNLERASSSQFDRVMVDVFVVDVFVELMG
jgi:HD-GYP domain-containing protein (c-di-GMP phosphodiesterase class II)